MDYKDDKGEWIGFDAELAQMFAEELGVNCQLVIIPWSNKVAELNGRQIDLVWNGMTASDELGEQIDFSVSYAKNAQVVIVKKGSTLTADGLKDATIAVEAGSAGEAVYLFNKAIIDATAEYAVAYKPNLAFYEAQGIKGWISFEKTVEYIKGFIDKGTAIGIDKYQTQQRTRWI